MASDVVSTKPSASTHGKVATAGVGPIETSKQELANKIANVSPFKMIILASHTCFGYATVVLYIHTYKYIPHTHKNML